MKFESSLVFLNVYTMNYTYSNDLYMYQKKNAKLRKRKKKHHSLIAKNMAIYYILYIYIENVTNTRFGKQLS